MLDSLAIMPTASFFAMHPVWESGAFTPLGLLVVLFACPALLGLAFILIGYCARSSGFWFAGLLIMPLAAIAPTAAFMAKSFFDGRVDAMLGISAVLAGLYLLSLLYSFLVPPRG